MLLLIAGNAGNMLVVSASMPQLPCHPLIILSAGLRPVRMGGEASGDTPHPGRGETPAPRVMSGCQMNPGDQGDSKVSPASALDFSIAFLVITHKSVRSDKPVLIC